MLAVPLAIVTVTRAGDDNYAFATEWLASVPVIPPAREPHPVCGSPGWVTR